MNDRKFSTRVSVVAILFTCAAIVFITSSVLDLGNWSSDYYMLYSRPNALASYLSLTGFEGVGTSHLFILSAQRLAHSWARHVPWESRKDYDMVLIITDPYGLLTPMSAAILRGSGWMLIKVEPLYGKPSAPNYLAQNRYTHTAQFTKLQLWNLEGYNHIIYMDSDMLILKDVVNATAPYKVTKDTLGVAQCLDGPMINAGMLLITPSKPVFQAMMSEVMTSEYFTFYQEQGFLDVYWRNRTVIMPSHVNEFVMNITADCVVLHFIADNKPWKICPDPVVHSRACAEWYSYDKSQ